MGHGKGDHRRSYAHAISGVEYAQKIEQIDWTNDREHVESRRVCLECKTEKPFGRFCSACDRDTDSERVYDA